MRATPTQSALGTLYLRDN
ncbi:unnamed protein product, partial [Tilletia caries]